MLILQHGTDAILSQTNEALTRLIVLTLTSTVLVARTNITEAPGAICGNKSRAKTKCRLSKTSRIAIKSTFGIIGA